MSVPSHSCTNDVLVALTTLLMTHHFNATRANVSCARLIQASAPLLVVIRSVSVPFVGIFYLRQVIFVLIRILTWRHRAKRISLSTFTTYGFCRVFSWWNWRIVVDSVDMRVLWSERAVGLQGHGTKGKSSNMVAERHLPITKQISNQSQR